MEWKNSIWKIDLTRYVDCQITWAEAGQQKGDEIQGCESEQLRPISAEIINDLNGLIRTDTEKRIEALERRQA